MTVVGSQLYPGMPSPGHAWSQQLVEDFVNYVSSTLQQATAANILARVFATGMPSFATCSSDGVLTIYGTSLCVATHLLTGVDGRLPYVLVGFPNADTQLD